MGKGKEEVLTTTLAVVSILVAVVGLAINLIAVGVYVGRLDGFKELVNHRFNQQDEKLKEHNNFIKRLYQVEKEESVLEEKIDVANNRIKDLENAQHECIYKKG